jgi:hypothetical protein
LKHLLIVLAILFAIPLFGQEHAPTKEQCFPDMKVWLQPMSEGVPAFKESVKSISAEELSKRRYEMAQCQAVDDAHSLEYETVAKGYNAALQGRMEDFIRRHPEMMNQFLKEDAATR